MSVFASLSAPDDSYHGDGCAVFVEASLGVLEFSGKDCDCGKPDSPIVYMGSHVVPSDEDAREGVVDIALIPSHITRDGRDDQPEDGTPWPFLRFGVNEGTVILTPRNVRQIRDTLTDWLDSLGAENGHTRSET